MRDATFAELVFLRTLAHLQHHDRSYGRQPLVGELRLTVFITDKKSSGQPVPASLCSALQTSEADAHNR